MNAANWLWLVVTSSFVLAPAALDAATVTKLYDNLDFQRGTQAFLNTNAAASMVAMRKGSREPGSRQPDRRPVRDPD